MIGLPQVALIEDRATAESFRSLLQQIEQLKKDLNVSRDSGEWTPVPTFAVPGDAAFVPSTQVGLWTRSDNVVDLWGTVIGTLTHTTAANAFQIDGMPFPVKNVVGYRPTGSLYWTFNITAGYTCVTPWGQETQERIRFIASGDGVALYILTQLDVPSPATLNMAFHFRYLTD